VVIIVGNKQTPSAKDSKRVLALLADKPVFSTGGKGRLCGKIAGMLNISSATVSGVLEGNDKVVVTSKPDGTWIAKLAQVS
jgi:hypothetical protein